VPEPYVSPAFHLIDEARAAARAKADEHFAAGVAVAKQVLPPPFLEIAKVIMTRPPGWTAAQVRLLVTVQLEDALPLGVFLKYEGGAWRLDDYVVLLLGWSIEHPRFKDWQDALLFATECHRESPQQVMATGMVQ
jgi:hypothetical protein